MSKERVVDVELVVDGQPVQYPFHFGMSTIRSFAVKKGWVSYPFTKILHGIIGEEASFIDQTEFFVEAMKAGKSARKFMTPMPPESDIQEHFPVILKAAADTIAAYLTEHKPESKDEPGKD